MVQVCEVLGVRARKITDSRVQSRSHGPVTARANFLLRRSVKWTSWSRCTPSMASRRKRTILQADPDASSEYSISLTQAYRPAVSGAATPSTANSSRSSTPAFGTVETTSRDRRRVRREPFPIPSSGAEDASDSTHDVLLDDQNIFANDEPQDAGQAEEEAIGEAGSKAKRYLSSVSTPLPSRLMLELTKSRTSQ